MQPAPSLDMSRQPACLPWSPALPSRACLVPGPSGSSTRSSSSFFAAWQEQRGGRQAQVGSEAAGANISSSEPLPTYLPGATAMSFSHRLGTCWLPGARAGSLLHGHEGLRGWDRVCSVVWVGTSLPHKSQLEGTTEEGSGAREGNGGCWSHPSPWRQRGLGELPRTGAACAATFALVLQQELASGSGSSRQRHTNTSRSPSLCVTAERSHRVTGKILLLVHLNVLLLLPASALVQTGLQHSTDHGVFTIAFFAIGLWFQTPVSTWKEPSKGGAVTGVFS